MITKEHTQEEHKNFRTILTIIQSCFIFFLIILVIFMMIQIKKLQGTARVINYAGLVRGATQRLVKLEITKNPDDELVTYLDEILVDLKSGNGDYNLVILDDDTYKQKINNLTLYWGNIKEKINEIRADGYNDESISELVDMSEVYFHLADETVSIAEEYSDDIAKDISTIEIFSAIDMFLLFLMIVIQSVSVMRIYRKNIILSQKAYIDTHTGLKNKNMCEELLGNPSTLTQPTAFFMFDINNLKHTNDTNGHSAGDRLIADFAKILKSVAGENDFAGRCGGDEFILVIYDITDNSVNDLIKNLNSEVEHFNSLGRNIPISYAYGVSISDGRTDCTMKTLFDEADRCMYANKRDMKAKNKEN